jgi:hypothetical protein
LLAATKASDTEELKNLVLNEYHKFMNLFGKPLAKELPL